jgi:hypothetical protein
VNGGLPQRANHPVPFDKILHRTDIGTPRIKSGMITRGFGYFHGHTGVKNERMDRHGALIKETIRFKETVELEVNIRMNGPAIPGTIF